MPENTPQTSAESEQEISEKWKQIISEATFHFTNRAAISANATEVRLVFLDELPNGKLVPKVGAVMSHPQARRLLKLLQDHFAKIEADAAAKKLAAPVTIPPTKEPEPS